MSDKEKNLRYVATLPDRPIETSNVGIDQSDMFGDTVFPGKLQKFGEIFSDVFVDDLAKASKGMGQGIIFSILSILAFIYLPKSVPFILVPLIFAFIAGIGFAAARIWIFVYSSLDRPAAALRHAGGDGWIALAKQDKDFQKVLEKRVAE